MEKKRTRRVSVKCCVCAPTNTPMQHFSKSTAMLLGGTERTVIRGTDIKESIVVSLITFQIVTVMFTIYCTIRVWIFLQKPESRAFNIRTDMFQGFVAKSVKILVWSGLKINGLLYQALVFRAFSNDKLRQKWLWEILTDHRFSVFLHHEVTRNQFLLNHFRYLMMCEKFLT